MEPVKAIIVDDEEDARAVIYQLITNANYPIEIVKLCSGVEEAVEAIKEYNPKVVFLDIEMPVYAGYELVNFFDEVTFEIIFTTAYSQYAIQAFQLSAVDYLLKPIDRRLLGEAIEKVLVKVQNENTVLAYEALKSNMQSEYDQVILIPELSGKRVIKLNDIICIKGQGSYSDIILRDEKPLTVSKNLRYFESVLPDNSIFFRSQKSWIVNLNYIEKISKSAKLVLMQDGTEAKVSINAFDDLEEKFNSLSN